MITTCSNYAATLTLACAFCAPATLLAQSSDAPPTRPGGISAQLYSNAGGEIFWDRANDDQGVRGYEITQNGRVIGVRDALSYYDASLLPTQRYTFTVAAVDTANQRSPAVSLVIDNGVVSIPNSQPPIAGNAPAAPSNLRAQAYSSSSAELFWNRPADPTLRYEVSRNNNVLGIIDGVSYYDDQLNADSTWTYSVVAIDSNGRRSDPSAVMFNTLSGSSNPITPETPQPGEAIPAPSEVRLQRYSTTAAELFWSRPSAATGILRTDILRNGVVIGTTPGNSYFDDTRQAGDHYTYQLVAVSATGRSDITSISDSPVPMMPTLARQNNLDGPSQPTIADIQSLFTSVGTGSPLSVDNARNFLPAVFRIANGQPAVLVHEHFVRVFKEALGALSGNDTSRFVAQSSTTSSTTLTCPGGGTYQIASWTNNTSGVVLLDGDTLHKFTDCLIDSQQLNGNFVTYNYDFSDPDNARITAITGVGDRPNQPASDLIYTAGGVTLNFSGFYQNGARFIYGGGLNEHRISYQGQSLTIEYFTGHDTQVVTPSMDLSGLNNYKRFQSSFTMSGDPTNGREIAVDTLDPFVTNSATGPYTRGLLIATDATDVTGGKLSVTANAGAANFTVRVDTAGRVDRFDQPWTQVLDFIRYPNLIRPPLR